MADATPQNLFSRLQQQMSQYEAETGRRVGPDVLNSFLESSLAAEASQATAREQVATQKEQFAVTSGQTQQGIELEKQRIKDEAAAAKAAGTTQLISGAAQLGVIGSMPIGAKGGSAFGEIGSAAKSAYGAVAGQPGGAASLAARVSDVTSGTGFAADPMAALSPAGGEAATGAGALSTAAGYALPVAGGILGLYTMSKAHGKPLKGAIGGAETGAAIGSVVPGVGTAIGAIVGGIIGAISSLF